MREKKEKIESFLKEYRCYVTIMLVILNLLWFLYVSLRGGLDNSQGLLKYGAMTSDALQQGNYRSLFTAMFMHFDIRHVANNMLMLFAMGSLLERTTGSLEFLLIYLGSGIGGNIISALAHMMRGTMVLSAGASGAVYGIVGAFLSVVLLHHGRVRDMTTKRMGLFVVLVLYQSFTSQGVDNDAHVGGFLCGFVLAFLLEYGKRLVNKNKTIDRV